MSNSEKISEQLSAYLDGELSGEETRRVDEMLADDPALSDELESMREVRQLLRSLPHAQAPDGLIYAALARTQRRRSGWWAGRLARAAVIILAVGVGVTVTSWLNRPAEQSGQQTPPHLKRPPLARGGLVDVDDAVTDVFVMNIDNLPVTQRKVEGIFGRNGIRPVVATSELVRVTKPAPSELVGRGNFYNQTQVTPKQVRYELAITENQMRQVLSELNEIRARQVVSQCSVRPRRAGDKVIALAKADLNDKSATGTEKAAEYAKMRRAAARRTRSEAIAKHKGADSRPAHAAKPSTDPTTRPTTIVMKQHKVGETLDDQKAVHRQPTTTPATANVRQLVVILNVVKQE